jgi:ribosomal protein S12 methylthiotransferase accessory factor
MSAAASTTAAPGLHAALRAIVQPFGLVNELRGDRLEDAGREYHLYRARINAIGRTGLITPPLTGFGFSEDEDDASLKAVCEALERFCGVNHVPTACRAPWDAVAARALDPAHCVHFDASQYADPSFPFRPFDRAAAHDWVAAHEAATGAPVLVHADLACMSSTSTLARTSSVGMAVHTEPALAAESAALELVERDHLALAFWRGRPCPTLGTGDLPAEMALHLESIRRAGYRVHALWLSYGLGVQVVLWMGFHDTLLPHFIKGAAAHRSLNLARAKAFEEMFRSFLYYRTHPFKRSAQAHGAMKNLMHYQSPDVARRLGFLVGVPATADAQAQAQADAAADPDGIYHGLARHGLRCYLVDMTHPFLRDLGLHCARAIAPALVHSPLGSEPWQLASPRLRQPGDPRDAALVAQPEPHFFS